MRISATARARVSRQCVISRELAGPKNNLNRVVRMGNLLISKCLEEVVSHLSCSFRIGQAEPSFCPSFRAWGSAVMARSYARGEWPAARRVCSTPGDNESRVRETSSSPYREPTLVPWFSRLRSVGHTVRRGNSAK